MKTKTEQTKHFYKTFLVFLCLAIFATFAVTAQTAGLDQIEGFSDKILELFQSSWIKVICLIALIIEAIGVVVAGQQGGGGQIIKKFAPWIIGTLILLSASGITTYFLEGLEFKY